MTNEKSNWARGKGRRRNRFVQNLTQKGSKRPAGGEKTRYGRRLALESLEERALLAVIAGTESALPAPDPTGADAVLVTTLADTVDANDGVVSLREAIAAVEAGGTITFDAALAGGTITLSGTQLSIAKSLTIDASALTDGITINANRRSRVFSVSGGGIESPIILIGLTITGGKTTGDGGGINNTSVLLTLTGCTIFGNYAGNGGLGGGINNTSGRLMLTGWTISGNYAEGNRDVFGGGGIYNGGTLTLTGCTISGNFADFESCGGGICNSGTLTLTDCTISGNYASASGGGIYNGGTLTLTGCAISGNYTGDGGLGGGIYNGGTLTLTGCAISGNFTSNPWTGNGGGIFNDNEGTLTLTGCTIAGNSASYGGGGIYNNYGTLTLTNTIVAMNYAGVRNNDISGSVSELSGNNIIGYNPTFVVAPVFNVSGRLTNAASLNLRLTSGSRGINAGSMVDDLPEFDLDGNARVYGGVVDIGAYEYQGTPASQPTLYSTVVNTLNDSFDARDSEWSLREALYWATSPGTITFAESIAGGRIRLNRRLDFYGMNIDGGQLGITLDAQRKSRMLFTSGEVTLRGLTLTGGETGYFGFGGGIYNEGTLTLIGCTISGNSAEFGGGGIYNEGTLTLTGCTFSGNSANYGGGICNNSSGTLTLTGCTISDNSANSDGGGIYNDSGTLTLTGCTIADNSASYGGGIYNGYDGTRTLYNSIVFFNTASVSGNDIFKFGGSVSAYNTLSSYAAWDAGSDNPVYDAAKPLFTDAAGGDYTLCENSQAIDVGNNAYAVYPDGSAIKFDLAGKARIVGGVVDLGAYEYQSGILPVEPLDAPVNVAVASGGANRHAVSWNAVENALGYTLAYSTNQTAWQTADVVGVSSVVSGLSYGTTVYYRVKALGDGVSFADSDWSATASLAVCPMDINGDGRINAGDQTILSINWNKRIGSSDADPRCDINGDGRINAGDQTVLSVNWNKRTDAADLSYPEALAAAFVPASAAIDAVFDDAFESAWEDDEFEFFG